MTPTETLPKVALSSGGRMLIGSDWREAQSGKRFKTLNPATGDTLLEVAEGDAPDVDLAVQAARRAFEGPWGKMSASERGRLLWRLGDLINAKLIVQDPGGAGDTPSANRFGWVAQISSVAAGAFQSRGTWAVTAP